MTNATLGRTIGALILVQMAAGIPVNFTLLDPVFEAPGFLVNAALHPLNLALSASMGLATSVLSIAIVILAWPLFRRHSPALALWLLVLSTARFTLGAIESTTLMSMLSLSQAHAGLTTVDADTFQALRGIVGSARNWAHYIHLMISGGTLFVFYLLLFRSVLVPRLIAGFGITATLLQITAVTMPLFGQKVMFPLLMPLGLAQLALALWLLIKGFSTRDRDNGTASIAD